MYPCVRRCKEPNVLTRHFVARSLGSLPKEKYNLHSFSEEIERGLVTIVPDTESLSGLITEASSSLLGEVGVTPKVCKFHREAR